MSTMYGLAAIEPCQTSTCDTTGACPAYCPGQFMGGQFDENDLFSKRDARSKWRSDAEAGAIEG